ncbi:hypothetical protein McpSp1_16990 [Methanocorpusculaceae archaeon Sp1]|nr:hypothetical protein [Methanocorpusculaceae archaeon Sp1]
MKHLLLLFLLITAVLLTAGCIASESPADKTPTPSATGTIPTAAIIPDNDIIGLDVLTIYRGADVMRELPTIQLKDGSTAYLIEVTVTCETLGKNSHREGYIGSVTISDHDLLLSVENGTSKTTHPATHLLPVPEKYHKKMLYDDIILKEGESVTGWVLYTNVPQGNATLTMPEFDAEEVRI